MSRLWLSLAAACVVAANSATAENSIILHCGHVIDPVVAAAPVAQRTILVASGHIQRILPGYASGGENTRVVDLTKQYCLPGLIDSHTHLTLQSRSGGEFDVFVIGVAEQALMSVGNASKTLLAGFTTVRDLGSGDDLDIALKHAIEKGALVGPRMYVATNALSITGGHADWTAGFREDIVGIPSEKVGVADGTDSVIRAVRMNVKHGADVIKVMASGGVISLGDSTSQPQYSQAEIRAAVDEARDHGLKVAAHAHADIGAWRAVMAGVASIEHGTFLTSKTYELMKKKGVFLVPTVSAGMFIAKAAKIPGFYPPAIAQKALEVGPQMQSGLSRAYHAGVRIAFGTDAGVFPHGENAKEFVYMVEAGMSPLDALRAATGNAAELLGREKDIGSLEPGKLADVIACSSNPLEHVEALQTISFVMKEGRIYKQDGRASEP